MKDVEVLCYLALFSREVRKNVVCYHFSKKSHSGFLPVENKLEFKNPIELDQYLETRI